MVPELALFGFISFPLIMIVLFSTAVGVTGLGIGVGTGVITAIERSGTVVTPHRPVR
jgi:hypothetical protein